MNLKINVFGEKVQVFCNDKPIDLGADAFVLGLMTDWRVRGGLPAPFTTAEIARLTARERNEDSPDDSQLSRVRKAKDRIGKRLIRELGLISATSLEDIALKARTDAALFRQGIEEGQQARSPLELQKLERALLLYDTLFKENRSLDAELADEITSVQREYDALFCSGIEVLMQQASPGLHTVIAAKIHQIQNSATIDTLKPGLLYGYQHAVARRTAQIPLPTSDLIVDKVIVDSKGRPTNLTNRREDFIGRETEAEQIKAYLTQEWLVTLTGVGGCGKTTLMREIGWHVVTNGMEEFPDGVWFVNLIPITPKGDKEDKEALARQILKNLGLRLISEASAHDALVDYLQQKRMLLLLDNCEHLEKAVVRLLSTIGDSCPAVKLMTTTRMARASKWGRQVKLLPFVPLDPEDLPELSVALRNEAVRLFQYYRQKNGIEFQMSGDDLAPVAEICCLLGGIPLAIELVSGTEGKLANLAASLKSHWEALPNVPDDAEGRHETMSHCILWSYQRLSQEEQVLFRRLALFTGGWTLAMCQEVCTLRGLASERVFDILSGLCQNSMIMLDKPLDRYHFLEPLRAFAEKQLESSGEKEEVLLRMGTWLMPMFQLDDFRFIGSEDEEKVHRALEETANAEKFVVERAKKSEISAFDVELHSLVYRFAEGAFRTVRRRLTVFNNLVDRASCEKQMRYHLTMGAISFSESNYEEAIEHGEKGLPAAISIGDKKHVALAHSAIGLCKAFLNLPGAEDQVQRGWVVAQETQDDWAIAFSQMCRGAWHWQSGHLEQALAEYEVAFAGFQQQRRDKIMSAMALNSLAHLVRRSGDPSRAAGYYLDSMTLSIEGKFKNARGIAGCLLGACGVALALQRYEQAAHFWGAAETHYARLGARLIPPIKSDYDQDIPVVQQKLGSHFTQLHRDGKCLSLTDAAKQAQNFLESVHAPKEQDFGFSLPTL